MIASIIECAVCYEDIRRNSMLLIATLLGSNQNQRQLTCWLPNLLLLSNLLSVCRSHSCSLIVSRFHLTVVDLVTAVMSAAIHGFFLLFLSNDATPHYIKSSLGFCDEFAVLMLFKTHVLLLDLFLSWFAVFIEWLWMNSSMEPFGS